jgi:hypothetical protein
LKAELPRSMRLFVVDIKGIFESKVTQVIVALRVVAEMKDRDVLWISGYGATVLHHR